MRVSVEVDVDDVLEEIDDDVLQGEMRKRGIHIATQDAGDDPIALLEKIYWYFRDKGDAPDFVREYLWQTLGRSL